MAASEENSSLFPIFILTMLELPLVPYTISKLCHAAKKKSKSLHCQCAVCSRSGKCHKSLFKRDKSGADLVAHERYAEPKEVEKVVITPVKKELGLAFKGNQKMVVEALEAMDGKEAMEMKANLESKGKVEFRVCTSSWKGCDDNQQDGNHCEGDQERTPEDIYAISN